MREPKLGHLDEAAIESLVEIVMPPKRRWWQVWARSDDDRYRLAFALRGFLLRARDLQRWNREAQSSKEA